MPKKLTAVSFNVIWPACIQCGACVAVCLQREPFISAFDTIAIETPCHIACMRCVEICPTSAITHRMLNLTPAPLLQSRVASAQGADAAHATSVRDTGQGEGRKLPSR